MADSKISDLSRLRSPTGAADFVLAEAGASKRLTFGDLETVVSPIHLTDRAFTGYTVVTSLGGGLTAGQAYFYLAQNAAGAYVRHLLVGAKNADDALALGEVLAAGTRLEVSKDASNYFYGVIESTSSQTIGTENYTVAVFGENETEAAGSLAANDSVSLTSRGRALRWSDVSQVISPNSLAVPSSESVRLLAQRLLELFPQIGGTSMGSMEFFSRGSLTASATLAQVKARCVAGNALTQAAVPLYHTNQVSFFSALPTIDNYIGRLRVKFTALANLTGWWWWAISDDWLGGDLGLASANGAFNASATRFAAFSGSAVSGGHTISVSAGQVFWLDLYFMEISGGQSMHLVFAPKSAPLPHERGYLFGGYNNGTVEIHGSGGGPLDSVLG